jgi:hypothetical protein
VQLSFVARFPQFHSIHLAIRSEINYFKNHILTFKGSYDQFYVKLEFFIRTYQRANYEFQLITIATVPHSTVHPSLISALTDFLISEEGNDRNRMESSTMQIVYEFYLSIIGDVSEGDALMNLCNTIRTEMFKDPNPFRRRMSIPDSFYRSFSQSMKLLNSTQHRTTYRNFNNVQEVRFLNVIQNFWRNQRDLTGSCNRNCHDIRNINHNAAGCLGAVRNCAHLSGGRQDVLLYRSVSF